MSDDLIEKITEAKNHMKIYRDYKIPLRLAFSPQELDDILSALKTVQGIESLRKTIYGLEYDDSEWTVSTLVKVHRRQTLALAVEAATQ